MKNGIVAIVFTVALAGFAASARAECTFPRAPASIPDGNTASEQEMVAAMNAFKAYNEEVTAFGTCLDDEIDSKSPGSAQLMQMKTMKTKKLNAAIAELETKARQFNEQVRAFKARS
ncbi:hypothetical protein [Povalibacter sp.]|uniref:hypothetical protein n=1 Tax=Povalibacter sp. TaxID=1962978 RepID=UPI002F3F4004